MILQISASTPTIPSNPHLLNHTYKNKNKSRMSSEWNQFLIQTSTNVMWIAIYSLEEKSRQISFRSDLKWWSFWLLSKKSSCSGACRRRSRCHEFPPCRSVLSTPLRRRQSEVQWSQVSLHRSQPGLFGTTNPSSPIFRRTQMSPQQKETKAQEQDM